MNVLRGFVMRANASTSRRLAAMYKQLLVSRLLLPPPV